MILYKTEFTIPFNYISDPMQNGNLQRLERQLYLVV